MKKFRVSGTLELLPILDDKGDFDVNSFLSSDNILPIECLIVEIKLLLMLFRGCVELDSLVDRSYSS